jgi:maleate isomerase
LGYGSKCRIGLLVPSSNTTMEPELYRMAPAGVSIHTARMMLEDVTLETLIKMAEEAVMEAEGLATAEVDLILYGCTSGSFVGGVGWEEKLVYKIERKIGIPTISTSRAVIDALRELNVKKIAVATPYTDEVNQRARNFLEAYGFSVTAIRGLGIVKGVDIGRVEGPTVERLVESVVNGADAVFISCTNLPTIKLIEAIEEKVKCPIVTSNQASLWAALRRFHLTGVKGYGILLSSHL